MLKLLYHLCFIAVAGYIIFATIQFRNNFAAAQNERIQSHLQYLELQKALRDRPQKLLFVGDIMLAREVGKMIKEQNDSRWPFLKIASTLRAADFTFGNLEGPISDEGKNQGSIYSFRADPSTVDGLTFAGFDVLSLANNHIWDWGSAALEETIKILTENNIRPMGAGSNYREANAPIQITIGDARLTLFAYTNLYPASLKATTNSAGISDFNETKIMSAIAEAKKEGDLVIVSLHWGDEYKTTANEFQRRFAHELIDAGADLIVGHHPHVTEETELYVSSVILNDSEGSDSKHTGYIAYSLGNFVFDQTFSEATMRGLILEVIVHNKKITAVNEIPVQISESFQPSVTK